MTDRKDQSQTHGAAENTKNYAMLDYSMLYVVVLSLIIGALAALFSKVLLVFLEIAFPYLGDFTNTNQGAHGVPGESTLQLVNIGAMVVLSVFVGCMTYYVMPNRTVRNLSHIIEDIHFNKGQTPVREGFLVGALSAVSIVAGASLGRFAPAIHMGASAASAIGQIFKMNDEQKLTLGCAGIAAAISCSFLAPLGAVMFVQEVVLRQWRLYQFIPIAAAAVMGSEMAQILGVEFTVNVEIPPDNIPIPELVVFSLIGIACGLVGIAFNKSVIKAGSWVAQNIKVDSRVKPAIGALILGSMCFYYPSVLGIGTYETQLAISGGIALHLCLIMLGLKFVATITSASFGFYGGVFAPSLFMGAMLGAAIGLAAQDLAVTVSSIAVYAVAGMGAMFAVILGAVLSAIVVMIEMTGKLDVSLPLLFSVTWAYVVVYSFSESSLLVKGLKTRNKNPFQEVKAADMKYAGVTPEPDLTTVARTIFPMKPGKKSGGGRSMLLTLGLLLVAGVGYVAMEAEQVAGWLAPLMGKNVMPEPPSISMKPQPAPAPPYAAPSQPPSDTGSPTEQTPMEAGPPPSATPFAATPPPPSAASPADSVPSPVFAEKQKVAVIANPTIPAETVPLSLDPAGMKPGPVVRPSGTLIVLDGDLQPDGWVYLVKTEDGTKGWIKEKRLRLKF